MFGQGFGCPAGNCFLGILGQIFAIGFEQGLPVSAHIVMNEVLMPLVPYLRNRKNLEFT